METLIPSPSISVSIPTDSWSRVALFTVLVFVLGIVLGIAKVPLLAFVHSLAAASAADALLLILSVWIACLIFKKRVAVSAKVFASKSIAVFIIIQILSKLSIFSLLLRTGSSIPQSYLLLYVGVPVILPICIYGVVVYVFAKRYPIKTSIASTESVPAIEGTIPAKADSRVSISALNILAVGLLVVSGFVGWLAAVFSGAVIPGMEIFIAILYGACAIATIVCIVFSQTRRSLRFASIALLMPFAWFALLLVTSSVLSIFSPH
jgi:hypothetical protein